MVKKKKIDKFIQPTFSSHKCLSTFNYDSSIIKICRELGRIVLY